MGNISAKARFDWIADQLTQDSEEDAAFKPARDERASNDLGNLLERRMRR